MQVLDDRLSRGYVSAVRLKAVLACGYRNNNRTTSWGGRIVHASGAAIEFLMP
jgi:hypothetical protein